MLLVLTVGRVRVKVGELMVSVCELSRVFRRNSQENREDSWEKLFNELLMETFTSFLKLLKLQNPPEAEKDENNFSTSPPISNSKPTFLV